MKAFIWGVVTVIVLIMLGGAIFVWSGMYNVAADVPHYQVTFWLLDEARERSVAFHSRGIVPPSLAGQKLVDVGFPHYHEMCRLCHGAPGVPRLEFAQGLYPNPPSLVSDDVQQDLSDAELFWLVKNGLKMTGMPSFGNTHTEEQLWGIVAFLRRLPNLAPEDYGAMVKAEMGSSPEGEGQEQQGTAPLTGLREGPSGNTQPFEAGQKIFVANCSGCHPHGGNILRPNLPLKGSPRLTNFETFSAFIRTPKMPDGSRGPMPAFPPMKIPEEDAKALYGYISHVLDQPSEG
jgi:mono/diheme cytochrome c family protein